MKIIACTIWYDEHPDDIREMCLSLKGFATGMAALDGAFETFPHEFPWSPLEQWQALIEGCAEAGMELLGYRPVLARGNEVEKRNASLKYAGLLGADWVVAVDPDMRLERGWQEALPLLDGSDLRVAITFTAGASLRNCFRWTPTLRYVSSHYTLIDGNALIAWPRVIEAGNRGTMTTSEVQENPLGQKQSVEALDLSDSVRFGHVGKRDPERRARQDAWYALRDRHTLESLNTY